MAVKDNASERFKFKRLKSQVFVIIDDKKKEFGRIRVEPDAISWRPTGTAQWHRLTIKQFAKLALQHGVQGSDAV